MADRLTGVLLNWRRRSLSSGVSLTLQIGTRQDGEQSDGHSIVTVVLDDQQLHAVAQDLDQAAAERGIDIRERSKWRLW
jgi:hypothetical protein